MSEDKTDPHYWSEKFGEALAEAIENDPQIEAYLRSRETHLPSQEELESEESLQARVNRARDRYLSHTSPRSEADAAIYALSEKLARQNGELAELRERIAVLTIGKERASNLLLEMNKLVTRLEADNSRLSKDLYEAHKVIMEYQRGEHPRFDFTPGVD